MAGGQPKVAAMLHQSARTCALLGVATCLAAQEVVLPPGLDVREGNMLSGRPLTGHSGRHQFVIDRSLLTPLGAGWQVRELWFRRDMTLGTRAMQPGVVDLEVFAGNSGQSAQGPSESFSQNRAADVTRVFQGRIQLPAAPPATTTPAPWAPPFAVQIPFRQPVTDHGGNLLLEIVATQPAGQPESPFWVVDTEAFPDPGSITMFGQGCSLRSPPPDGSASLASLLPGNTTRFLLHFPPQGAVALHILGFSDQTLFGAPVLPLDLGAFGAAGCMLYTDWNAVTTHVATNSPGMRLTTARCDLRWPLDAGLLTATVFSQWLIVEPNANPLGLIATNATRVQLGAQLAAQGIALVSAGDAAAATGRVRTDVTPVLRLVR